MREIACACVIAGIVAMVGCDAVQGLVGGDKQANAAGKEEPAKAEASKPEAAAKTPASAEATPASAKTPASAEATPASAEATPASAEATPASAAGLGSAATPAPTAAGDAPCIVGEWEAVDYRAAIERAIHRDPELRQLEYGSSGGTLGYVVEPPTDGKKGTVRQIAEDVTYRFGGKVQGYQVSLTVELDGENVAPYELVGDDRIEIDDPTKKAMRVKAHASVKGVANLSKSKNVTLDFEGTFVYTCTDAELKVHAASDEKGRPLTFKRAANG